MSTSSPIHQREPRALAPDTLAALERAVAHLKTQSAVAEALNVSPSLINQALKGKYRGDIESLEQRIRGVLLNVTVTCPVLGELSTKDCLDQQRRKIAFTNPLRVLLARACKTCPNRKEATTGATKC